MERTAMNAERILLAAGVLLITLAAPVWGAVTVLPDGDHYAGEMITISGTTTFSPGNTMLIEVEPLGFGPTNKSEAPEVSGISGRAEVLSGDGVNTWSFEVDTEGFAPGEYLVRVEVLEAGAVETTTFTLREGPPPTEMPATTKTLLPGTTAPEEAPVTGPTEAGGSLMPAISALSVIAYLILKRRE
jgi:hypothetical protein